MIKWCYLRRMKAFNTSLVSVMRSLRTANTLTHLMMLIRYLEILFQSLWNVTTNSLTLSRGIDLAAMHRPSRYKTYLNVYKLGARWTLCTLYCFHSVYVLHKQSCMRCGITMLQPLMIPKKGTMNGCRIRDDTMCILWTVKFPFWIIFRTAYILIMIPSPYHPSILYVLGSFL